MKRTLPIILAIAIFIVAMGATHYMNRQLQLKKLNESPMDIPGIESPDASKTQNRPAAPDFVVENENGERISLSDYLGYPVVVCFWASYDETSAQNLNEFQESRRLYDDAVIFMMINTTVDEQETREAALAYLEGKDYTLDFYFDIWGEAKQTYNVTQLPSVVFVDQEGNIAATHQGEIDSDDITNVVDNLIVRNFFGK